jgi:FMN phosphatase YigB (HAD superfamily)
MKKTILVCDLDNTLYDWVSYFVTAFYAMVDETVRLTGCDRERLLDDFRFVHRMHHDSEHPFALLETNTIRELFPRQSQKEIARNLDSAFHAFNVSRKETLRLYPGVRETLETLSLSGVVLVAHTESKLYAVVDRLTRLDITKYFRRIYCRERPNTQHPNPNAVDGWLNKFPLGKVRELSHHQRKPNPDVLLEICRDQDASAEQAAYVGDSMARDILMARTAGIFSIWAKYGAAHGTKFYQKLVRVTHWTAEDVVRERELSERAKMITADYVLENGFSEITRMLLSTDDRSVAVG